MPRIYNDAKKQEYFKLRNENGFNNVETCKVLGIDNKTGSAWARGADNSGGIAARKLKEQAHLTAPKSDEELSKEALRGKKEFGYFRARYFGRKSSNWQEDAANQFVKYEATDVREFIVLNCPPGAGKSTLLHDIEAWLTIRNRAIRGMLGSSTEKAAKDYSLRLRRSFERRVPVRGEPEDVANGRAYDAQATLVGDYGRFQPEQRDLWRLDQFIVAQLDDIAIEEKEATWTAFGLDGTFLGQRVDIAVWDDVVTDKTLQTLDAIEKQRRKWDNEAETRLEPGGALFLVGQRLAPNDLYRYCLDKKVPVEIDDADLDEGYNVEDMVRIIEPQADEQMPRKYHQIVYPAHNESGCTRIHSRARAQEWPNGCLLDPIRLPYRELMGHQENDNQHYRTVYQQEDAAPEATLVKKAWITGGIDPVSGEQTRGCLDKQRRLHEVPAHLNAEALSVITVDPSPTMYWAVLWALVDMESEQRFFMDLVRKKMQSNDFLDYDAQSGQFSGVLEDVWQLSSQKGRPVKYLVVERNGAQRFLLHLDYFKRWCSIRNVSLFPHDTHGNKSDPEYGVQSIASVYRRGLVRIPSMDHGDLGFHTFKPLVDEVTAWPYGTTTDCVMAHWFLEYWIPRLAIPNIGEMPRRPVPSWMKAGA